MPNFEMPQHLEAFVNSFVAKRYQTAWLHAIAHTKPQDNLMRGADALWRELDERYCIKLPRGNQQQEIAFVSQAIALSKLTTCYVLSANEKFSRQTMLIDDALSKIIGSTSTTIISFVPGKVAYFEGHSPGNRYVCIRQ